MAPIGMLALAMQMSGRAAVPVSPPPVVASPCAAPAGFAPPFTTVYRLRGGGTLVFVAVRHGRDVGDASHRAIAQAIDRYRPGLILIEGIDTESPAAIAFQRAAAERQTQAGAIQETLYAVKLAGDRGIAFASWDYRPDEAMRRAVEAGYLLTDVVGAYLLRDGIDPALPAERQPAMRRTLEYARRVGAIDGFDYAVWLKGHYPAAPRAAYLSPCGNGVAARVLAAESDARSRRLADLIAARAMAGQVLMVEAGANHWLALDAYLRRLATSVN